MRYIVFDLDDTIVPSTQGYALAYKSIGIDYQSDEFMNARTIVKDRLPHGHTSARNRWLYIKQFLESRNEFSSSKLISLLTDYERTLVDFLHAEWRRLKRDDLFEKLRGMGHLCILTNENTRQQILKVQAIDPQNLYFQTILTSEEVGYEKPDLRCFNELARRFKNPTEIIFIGDNFENDLRPAHILGWKTVLNTEFTKTKNQEAETFYKTIFKLDELVDLIL